MTKKMSKMEVPKFRGARRRDDGIGLDRVDPSTHPSRDAASFRRIIAARKALEEAKQELRDSVAAAREAGDSWTVIGAALDTTRQAAYQRFGKIDA
jgi:hypothetical protein